MSAEEFVLLLPLLLQWIDVVRARGGDPEAELRAMLDTADRAADAIEKAKFGP